MSKDDMIREIHEKVNQIHTVLFGAEGQGGMIREMDGLSKRVTAHDHMLWKAAGAAAVLVGAIELFHRL